MGLEVAQSVLQLTPGIAVHRANLVSQATNKAGNKLRRTKDARVSSGRFSAANDGNDTVQ